MPLLRRVGFCSCGSARRPSQKLTADASKVPTAFYAHLAALSQCASLRQHGAGGA